MWLFPDLWIFKTCPSNILPFTFNKTDVFTTLGLSQMNDFWYTLDTLPKGYDFKVDSFCKSCAVSELRSTVNNLKIR